MGRPRVFKDPAALGLLIEAYFDQCADLKRPLTLAGLAAHLQVSRRTLLRYQGRAEFTDLLDVAKTRVEASVEERLLNGSASGPKFNLSNNFWGWGDKRPEEERPDGRLEQRMARARARVGLETPLAAEPGKEEDDRA